MNGDINASAAIAGTKISPDFGAQALTTSGNISTTGSGTITAAGRVRSDSGFDVATGGAVLHIGESLANQIVLDSALTTVDGAMTVAGTLSANGGIAVDGTAFTVADTTGDVATAGDVTINGGELNLTPVASSASTTEGTIYYDSTDDNLYVYANGGFVDLTAGASGAPTLDDAYNAGSGVETEIHVDNGGLTLSSEAASTNGDIAVDLTSTGDFSILNAGTAFATFDDSGNVAFTGTLGVTGATTVTGALYANGGLDRSAAAALAIGGTNATSVTIGGAANTALTVTTDGTGTAEVVLPAGSIDSTEILDSTIVSGDIVDGTVAAIDIATGGVETTEILDSTILTADISADTILAEDIATGAATTTEILDGTIAAIDVASGAITAPKLQAAAADLGGADVTVNFGNTNGAFNTNITTDGTMTATTFIGALTGNVTGTVSGNAGTVTNGVYTSDTGTVTGTMILDSTVASADIAADTIVAGDIATGAVTTTEILDDTIASADIAANTIVAGDIAADAIDGASLADTITLDANLALNGANVTGNGTLGEDATRWSTIYADTLNYATAITDDNAAGNYSTVTIGNDGTGTGGADADGLTIVADTAITDAQWSVTAAGAAAFASVDGPVGSVTPATGAFTTLSATGALTLANSETISTAVDGQFLLHRNDAGTVTLTTTDNDADADLLITSGGTGDITLGDAGTNVTVADTFTVTAGGATITAGGVTITAGGLNMTGDDITNAGTVTATTFSGALTGNVTGNVSGTAATVTTAAQPAITSVGTLTGLTSNGAVDFSGATSLEIPQGATLDCAAAGDVGRIFFDTDDGVAKICTNDADANGTDGDYALEALN
jgi:hypothetical protein